jgi:hypothetical protein
MIAKGHQVKSENEINLRIACDTGKGGFEPKGIMNKLFASNLKIEGRIVRGGISAVLLLAALLCFSISIGLAILLLIPGLFVLFEAVRGWCVLRACGIKTRI